MHACTAVTSASSPARRLPCRCLHLLPRACCAAGGQAGGGAVPWLVGTWALAALASALGLASPKVGGCPCIAMGHELRCSARSWSVVAAKLALQAGSAAGWPSVLSRQAAATAVLAGNRSRIGCACRQGWLSGGCLARSPAHSGPSSDLLQRRSSCPAPARRQLVCICSGFDSFALHATVNLLMDCT